MNMVTTIIAGVVKPITGLLGKKSDRKRARETAKGKLAAQKESGDQKIELTDAEWETVAQGLQPESWKDEYVTVSIVSLVNLIIIGGIASAFGYPQVLAGTVLAIEALVAAGVDLGWILNAVIMAAIGLKIWRA